LPISHFASNFALKSSTIEKTSKSWKFLYIRPWTFLSRVVAERISRITISRDLYLDNISYEDWARHYQLTFWWRRDAAAVHENPSTPELFRGSSFMFSMPKRLQTYGRMQSLPVIQISAIGPIHGKNNVPDV
jgi:hypothetical protein